MSSIYNISTTEVLAEPIGMMRVAEAQEVINHFKKDITYDPLNATAAWDDICADNSTFSCELNPFTNETYLAGIDFNGYGLEGELTLDFLLDLPDLGWFHGNSNNFTGSIPDDLSSLEWLYELDVSNNKLSGDFPEGVLTAPRKCKHPKLSPHTASY